MNIPRNTVTCLICNAKFKRVTHKHIKNHGITTKEYDDQFGITSKDRVSQAVKDSLATNSLAHFQKKYGGEMGRTKYEEYKRFQSTKNTYKYKQQTYGWTADQFRDYNTSRAATKDNFIKRHGIVKGTVLWDKYCERQAYAGSSLQYFIDVYGEEQGQVKWKQLCASKSNTLENYIKRHGKTAGAAKYAADRARQIGRLKMQLPHSKAAESFISKLHALLPQQIQNGSMFHPFTQEYIFQCGDRYFLADYYNFVTNRTIEFFGDFWHANPKMFDDDRYMYQGLTASSIRKRDAVRTELIRQHSPIMIIWESEANNDPTIIQRAIDFISK